jgi:hypothetical protein
MIAHRNGWIAFFMLMFAFVPTVASFYGNLPVLQNQVPQRIPETIDGMAGFPTQRKASDILDNFGTSDWSERTFQTHTGKSINLFVTRGYDCRPFFHLPEYAILDREWSERSYETDFWAIDGSQLAVHTLELTGLALDQKAYYLLIYENQAIYNPYWFLIRNMPQMLFKKRQPYILIFVSYKTDEKNEALDKLAKKVMLSVYSELL